MRALDLNKNWWIRGLTWGLLMFIFLGILFPLMRKESITVQEIFIDLAVWIVFGLIFGAVISSAKKEGSSKPN